MSFWGEASATLWDDYMRYCGPSDQSRLQAMSAEQMAEYQRRQGDPTNTPWELRMQAGSLQNYVRLRQPTMTLAEWDARRAAFNAT